MWGRAGRMIKQVVQSRCAWDVMQLNLPIPGDLFQGQDCARPLLALRDVSVLQNLH